MSIADIELRMADGMVRRAHHVLSPSKDGLRKVFAIRHSLFAILLNDSHRDDEHVAIRIVGAIGFRHP